MQPIAEPNVHFFAAGIFRKKNEARNAKRKADEEKLEHAAAMRRALEARLQLWMFFFLVLGAHIFSDLLICRAGLSSSVPPLSPPLTLPIDTSPSLSPLLSVCPSQSLLCRWTP